MSPHKPRILFVEDHDDTRELLSLVLREHYEVATAATVEDSLKLARQGKFNLFIFDSWLPDGYGVDLCKLVREFDRHTPILFYSGLSQKSDRDIALRAGAQGYLVKPVEVPELLQAVSELIIRYSRSTLELNAAKPIRLAASADSL